MLDMEKYGFKICYRDEGTKCHVRHFLTFTRRQAVEMLNFYIRYPPMEHEGRRALIKPKWKIIPVSRREVRAGIWEGCPF